MRTLAALGLALAIAALSLSTPASANSFPSQTVTIVVPTPAAGPLDLFARLIGPELSKRWNVPVIVRNQPGAGTALGTQTVARSKPDGHTMLVANIAISAHGALARSPLFDVEKDLQPVTLLASTPFFVFVPGGTYRTLEELLAAARKEPGKLNVAIIPNSQQHLDTERVLQAAGVKATLVPYQGTAPITQALLSNEIDVFLGSLGGMQGHLRVEKIRALASTGSTPSKHLPEVPTLKSRGINVELEPWYAVFAPAGLSPEVLAKLRGTILEVLAQPEIAAKINTAGYDLKTSSPEELARIASDNLKLSREIVRGSKIEPQ